MNNIYYDYIGSTGSYPIIDNFSNVLDDEIKNTSNILENHSSNYTSNSTCNLRKELWNVNPNNNNAYLKIIVDDNTNSNLHINNPNNFGKINFSTKNPLFPNATDILTRIDYDNKLYVYFGGSLLPPKPPKWWCVEEELSAINDNNTGQDTAITGLGIAVNEVWDTIGIISGQVQQLQIYTLLDTANNRIALVINGFTLAQNILLGASGISLALAAAALATASYINNNYISLNLYNQISSNNTITQTEKTDFLNILTSNNYSNSLLISSNMSNLNILNGFINSNITLQQTISNLKTMSLTIGSQNINNIFVAQNGGNMYDSLIFQKSSSGNPTAGYFEGTGARVVYNPSTTTTDYACSIGINNTTKKFWFSASSNYAYEYWFGGDNTLIISSNIMSYNNGIINATTIQQNSQNITDISSNIVLTQTPNVQKKKGFLIYVNNPIYPDAGSTVYYSYDIYLPSYISQSIVENTSDPYRTFRIHLSYASSYFEYTKNGLPNCLSYEIFMSYKANAGAGGIGKQYLNICALGTPENFYLDKVMPNDLFLMRSPFSYFDRICVISTKIADVRVIIEDLLN